MTGLDCFESESKPKLKEQIISPSFEYKYFFVEN